MQPDQPLSVPVDEFDTSAALSEVPPRDPQIDDWSHGMRCWTTLRAAWLRIPQHEVVKLPGSFEDAGLLQQEREGLVSVRELTDDELECLEDCLESVQRPFPALVRSVPLAQAIQCAESLWDSD